MRFDCTGVILAGGLNRRFPGRKKAFRMIGNTMIIEGIYEIFVELFKEVIIVVNEPQEFAGWNMTLVTDIIPSRCALAGIHAGLFYASFPYAYVTACDTPFLNPELIQHIVGKIQPGCDVIVPRTPDGLEPLSAVYSKRCIPRIEENLENNIFMIKKIFRKKKVKEIPVDELQNFDPEMRFSFNINTPEDLEIARQMMAETKKTARGVTYGDDSITGSDETAPGVS
ncbi:MAG: molybdenum cofactor guanylyltransferase [Proteobacteria bacterium]|nr:molybdenum cofactor guanylyltransferase [Pseudomonadota bacterium]MBU1388031.1 molybdenum cofactor guanylyltransferase [Pseudomonadota bacterium]MBU1542094.1 molybdenum cofactor guanylyltransferase [Pseudomonadota bacterium]MBU2429283.1 molybdenum cofactor guanylyltransferase [Pseudomonadota bacterium]MBU2482878.1 molybdenum cofactor guanylyltransferase [Pseudomonadota bacterium]